jgi:hypothetical protein
MKAMAMRMAESDAAIKKENQRASIELARNLRRQNGEADVSVKEQFVCEPFLMVGKRPELNNIDRV